MQTLKKSVSMMQINTWKGDIKDKKIKVAGDRLFRVKKSCKIATRAIKDTMTLKQCTEIEQMLRDSPYLKSSELLLQKEATSHYGIQRTAEKTRVTKIDSPVLQVIESLAEMYKNIANRQAESEKIIVETIIGKGAISEVLAKDVGRVDEDMKQYRQLVREEENLMSRKQKITEKIAQTSDDMEMSAPLKAKEEKLEEELRNMRINLAISKDKLCFSLYSTLAKEASLAQNIIEYVIQLKNYFSSVLAEVERVLPTMQKVMANTTKKPVFGHDLQSHIDTRQTEIAKPLEYSITCLMDHLDEEGLFRVSPSVGQLKKAKAQIDASLGIDDLEDPKELDPHVATGLIKSYLRELPNPLFRVDMVEDWQGAEQTDDITEKQERIKENLNQMPKCNRDNIAYLFRFVSKLVEHKEANKMTVENINIVLSPNLLWTSGGQSIILASVVRELVTNVDTYFPEDAFPQFKFHKAPVLKNQMPSIDEEDDSSTFSIDIEDAALGETRMSNRNSGSNTPLLIQQRSMFIRENSSESLNSRGSLANEDSTIEYRRKKSTQSLRRTPTHRRHKSASNIMEDMRGLVSHIRKRSILHEQEAVTLSEDESSSCLAGSIPMEDEKF